MTKTAAQLEHEIAEFLAKPQKLGDPAWERTWAGLLSEKHSKARMPTVDELARAFLYIEREFVLRDDRISAEHWAEGLAFGQRSSLDEESKRQAREALQQLSHGDWLRIAERANQISRDQHENPRYLK